MDELRSEVWDFLFRAEGSQHMDAIALHVGRHAEVIHSALDHEWFDVVGDLVAIAYPQRPQLQRPAGCADISGLRKVSDLADVNPLYDHDYLLNAEQSRGVTHLVFRERAR